MLDRNLVELIDYTAGILKLEVSVIEKDCYVTKVIELLSNIENEYFQLVFAGGTCLAKAHSIVKRMSEDVDFKIRPKSSAKDLNRSKHKKELKSLREKIISAVESIGFKKTDNGIVRNEGKYFQIKLDYPSQFSANAILKPHILLEFTESNLRLPTENRIVKTLIQETFKTLLPHLDEINVSCISVEETAAEKWVALTRRIAAIERGRFSDDLSLIRHVYDLMIINEACVLESNFCRLANNSIKQDADQFKNQHPEYFHNHAHEIMRSIEILTQTKWEIRYHDFIEAMVYDSKPAPSYVDAVRSLTVLTDKVIGTSPSLKKTMTELVTS